MECCLELLNKKQDVNLINKIKRFKFITRFLNTSRGFLSVILVKNSPLKRNTAKSVAPMELYAMESNSFPINLV